MGGRRRSLGDEVYYNWLWSLEGGQGPLGNLYDGRVLIHSPPLERGWVRGSFSAILESFQRKEDNANSRRLRLILKDLRKS